MNDFAPQQTNYIAPTEVGTTPPNSNKPKQDISYFGAMKRKFQDDNFIWYLKPEQIQKSAKERIFREMVRGVIDYSENGQYFYDSKFLENLLIAAQDELINNTIISDALKYYNNIFPGQNQSMKLQARYTNLAYIMSVIHAKLSETKYTGTIGPLTTIQYILVEYKNLM